MRVENGGRPVIDIRAAVGAVSAWRILKRHPCYREAWLGAADRIARSEGVPVPIRTQTEADLEAAPWGLLAWEDPFADEGQVSPFWADAPMPEGMQGRRETTSFSALVRSQGGGVSGLLLRDGAMILKVERNGMAGQVRIEDGAAFDPAGSLGLFLPWGDDHMSRELARGGDLREVVAGEGRENDPSPGNSRASCCSPSRESSRTNPNA